MAQRHNTETVVSTLGAALGYTREGRAVLPVNGKVPLTGHGVKDASRDEAAIREQWAHYPEAGVAIATGRVSGIVVLDVDGEKGEESMASFQTEHGPLPATRQAKTGRGRHLYFATSDTVRTRTIAPGLDLRGEGAYVVAPPSPYPGGGRYKFINSIEIALLPDALREVAATTGSENFSPSIGERIPDGERNTTLTSLAGSMRRRGMTEAAIFAALKQENSIRCDPPLPEKEVARIAASVSRYTPAPKSNVPAETAFEGLVTSGDLALKNEIRRIALDVQIPQFDKRRQIAEVIHGELNSKGQFFHTEDRRGFFFHNDERRLYDVEQSEFERLLISLSGLSTAETFFKFTLDLIQAFALRDSLYAEAQSLSYFDSKSGTLAVSDGGPGIWIRESSGEWQQVRNGDNGLFFLTDGDATPWTPNFKDGNSQRWWLDHFLFVDQILSTDESKTLLHLWLAHQFFPPLRRTRLIPAFLGPQGSGKTTAMRLVGRLLVGPKFDVTGIRRDKEDAFVAAATNRLVLGLDNVDSRIPWLADALATYATGQRYRLRKLYTTNEEAAYSPRAILLVSSRDPRFNRPDVAERMLPLHFERPVAYCGEDEIFRELEERRGQIMGALLLHIGSTADALANSSPKPLPFRMADYATFGERIFRPTGKSDEFLSLLTRVETAQAEFASESDGLVEVIRLLVEQEEVRDLAIRDLYKKCCVIAEQNSFAIPRSVQGFGRQLSNMRRVLEIELGAQVVETRGHGGRRFITLSPNRKGSSNVTP